MIDLVCCFDFFFPIECLVDFVGLTAEQVGCDCSETTKREKTVFSEFPRPTTFPTAYQRRVANCGGLSDFRSNKPYICAWRFGSPHINLKKEEKSNIADCRSVKSISSLMSTCVRALPHCHQRAPTRPLDPFGYNYSKVPNNPLQCHSQSIRIT